MKFFLILFLITLNSFSQSNEKIWIADKLGKYFIVQDNLKSKGLDFKIKIPCGYKPNGEGNNDITIQMFERFETDKTCDFEDLFLGYAYSGGDLMMIQLISFNQNSKYSSILGFNNQELRTKVQKNIKSHNEQYPNEQGEYYEYLDYYPTSITTFWRSDTGGMLVFQIYLENYALSVIFKSQYILGENDVNFVKGIIDSLEIL